MSSEQFFISYSRVDSEFAVRLTNDLRKAGIRVWFDQMDIPAGVHWDSEIEKALKAASSLIIIISASSVASKNVMAEVSYAIEEDKWVVPIILGNCEIPWRLRRLQWIDFSKDYKQAFTVLSNTLKKGKTDVEEKEIVEISTPTTNIFNIKWLITTGIIATLLLLVVVGIYLSKPNKSEIKVFQDSLMIDKDSNKDSSMEHSSMVSIRKPTVVQKEPTENKSRILENDTVLEPLTAVTEKFKCNIDGIRFEKPNSYGDYFISLSNQSSNKVDLIGKDGFYFFNGKMSLSGNKLTSINDKFKGVLEISEDCNHLYGRLDLTTESGILVLKIDYWKTE